MYFALMYVLFYMRSCETCGVMDTFKFSLENMKTDARAQQFDPDNVISNNDAVNNDMISEIEKELQDSPYDMISLVFLLYDVPDTALQRLIVFQRVSKDIGTSTNLNLLHEWFRRSKQTPTWKHEFVEALLLCQLNSIVRKLGFDVSLTRNHYQTDNIHVKMYINPVKKALYKLCENMNADNLIKLKKSLLTYDIDTAEYDSCELVFLKLMCEKFITLNQFQYNKKAFGLQVHLEKLLKIIEILPGLRNLALDINTLQDRINGEFQPSAPLALSTPSAHMKVDESNESTANEHLYCNDFQEVFGMLNKLNLEESANVKSLKSDKTGMENICYEIKNSKRLGVCVILNQVNFYPSKNSIENANQYVSLSTRKGSDKDKAVIERTMSALNFSVYSATDLDSKKIFLYLKKIITDKVSPDDSVFMLCILSHGVKGHIYAADSVKINMDNFQNLLDSDIAKNLHNKPKVLIVQACQVNENPSSKLVADSPVPNYTLKKSNCVIFWATAPELEAYRDEDQGSIFIQILCQLLLQYAKFEHICDIFTKVTDTVQDYCENLHCKKLRYEQVPIHHTTLRRKLFLQMPN